MKNSIILHSIIGSDHKVDEEHTLMTGPPSKVCQDIETAAVVLFTYLYKLDNCH